MPDGRWQAGKIGESVPEAGAVWRGYFDAAKHALQVYSDGRVGLYLLTRLLQSEGWAFCDRQGQPVAFEVDDVRRIVDNWAEYGGYVAPGRAKERHPFHHDWNDIQLVPERAVMNCDMLYQVARKRYERTSEPKDRGQAEADFSYPLKGLVYCAHCEQLAKTQKNPKLRSRLGGKNQNTYRHRPGVPCGCKRKSVLRSHIEARFLALIGELHVQPQYLDAMAQLVAQIGQLDVQDEAEFEAKRMAQIALCERRINAAVDLYGEGRISREDYRRRVDMNTREIEVLQAQTSDKARIVVELRAVFEVLENIANLWEKASHADKQHYAQLLFDELVYDLDAGEFVGFRLKPWASQYLVTRAMLGDDFKGAGTNMTPTGRRAVNRYVILLYVPNNIWLVFSTKSPHRRESLPQQSAIA